MTSSWLSFIETETNKPYYQTLQHFITSERNAGKVIYPNEEDVFSAFELTPLNKVKVVVIGQDPYHGPNQAHGLSFSVNKGVKIPPSLANIYKELATDIEGFEKPQHGDLRAWAEQGVLMLNTVLTVEQGKAHSHAKKGWEQFTDKALELLNQQPQQIIFLLWGSHAIKKSEKITNPAHKILQGPHPSPLSAYRGFFGCRHFSSTNQLLEKNAQQPIKWQL
ncbi:uracil-DNA glycosylase [Parashewanella spongiae]|uniref:Uracil-DNA glycosylase n=2 Tax=Parashewanella spongiae TaxID=342950 RepID=A0A3A6TVY4_9GAMM|nr:uracil-DNA glycosylase [Parashewanella spongiae]MCL1076689.1 uracil-DNA glycosylase [Parashewanella spongiae]RJY18497.1 uracil-DNA glycosylase [Parashewanella spongiae]